MTDLTIAKFGGSALGPDGIHIPRIIQRIGELKANGTKVIAVFSAPLTVTADNDGNSDKIRSLTDVMLEQGKNAQTPDAAPHRSLDLIRNAYMRILQEHLHGSENLKQKCQEIINNGLAKAQEALDSVAAANDRKFSGEARSKALAFSGEILMSHIMKYILIHNNIKTDSVKFENWPIITDDNIESANFLVAESREKIKTMHDMLEENQVVTIGGFIGKTRQGVITTYERGGTDRTAVDLGILFHKKYSTQIDFEKDSAVVSADPKIVKDNLSEVDQLSYNEARLAGMFGMKILDPVAIKEVVENGIDMPIVITNLNKPEKTTIITRTISADKQLSENPIKMVTGKSNCAIFRIEVSAIQKLLISLEKDKRYSEFVMLSPYTKDGMEFSRMLFLDADYIKNNEKYFMSFDPLATITYRRGVITLIGDEMWRVQQIASRTSARVGESGLNILNIDAQEETSRIIIVIEDAADNVAKAIASIHDEIIGINSATALAQQQQQQLQQEKIGV